MLVQSSINESVSPVTATKMYMAEAAVDTMVYMTLRCAWHSAYVAEALRDSGYLDELTAWIEVIAEPVTSIGVGKEYHVLREMLFEHISCMDCTSKEVEDFFGMPYEDALAESFNYLDIEAPALIGLVADVCEEIRAEAASEH